MCGDPMFRLCVLLSVGTTFLLCCSPTNSPLSDTGLPESEGRYNLPAQERSDERKDKRRESDTGEEDSGDQKVTKAPSSSEDNSKVSDKDPTSLGWKQVQSSASSAIRFFEQKPPAARTPLFLSQAPLSEVRVEVKHGNRSSAPTSVYTRSCEHGVNGGYFSGNQGLSLVKSFSKIVAKDAQGLNRPQGKANPFRATLFLGPARASMAWASVRNGSLQVSGSAIDPYAPQPSPKKLSWSPDEFPHALGGGPMLLYEGKSALNLTQEAFDGGIAASSGQPRTAVGFTAAKNLLTLVADGRGGYAGLTLSELTKQLKDLGATHAMALDGGGSSSFVVNGKVLNQPSDGRERAVTSALCVTKSK